MPYTKIVVTETEFNAFQFENSTEGCFNVLIKVRKELPLLNPFRVEIVEEQVDDPTKRVRTVDGKVPFHVEILNVPAHLSTKIEKVLYVKNQVMVNGQEETITYRLYPNFWLIEDDTNVVPNSHGYRVVSDDEFKNIIGSTVDSSE